MAYEERERERDSKRSLIEQSAKRAKTFDDDLQGRESAYRFGCYALGIVNGDLRLPVHLRQRSQFAVEKCKSMGVPLIWHPGWNDDPHVKTMTDKTNSGAGFLVPDEFQNTLIDLREKYGVFRRNITTGSIIAPGMYEVTYEMEISSLDEGWARVEFFKDIHTGKPIAGVDVTDGSSNGYTLINPYPMTDFSELKLPNPYSGTGALSL